MAANDNINQRYRGKSRHLAFFTAAPCHSCDWPLALSLNCTDYPRRKQPYQEPSYQRQSALTNLIGRKPALSKHQDRSEEAPFATDPTHDIDIFNEHVRPRSNNPRQSYTLSSLAAYSAIILSWGKLISSKPCAYGVGTSAPVILTAGASR